MRRLSDQELNAPRPAPVPRSRQQREAVPAPAAKPAPTARRVETTTAAALPTATPRIEPGFQPATETRPEQDVVREPDIETRREPEADIPADVSPGDIIARAASTMKEDKETRDIREQYTPELDLDTEDEPCAPLPMARPNHRARRRVQLAMSRVRKTARALRYAPVALVALGVPVWLWQAGHIEAAHNYLLRQTDAAASEVTDALELRVAGMRVDGAEMTGIKAIGKALSVQPGDSILSLDLHAARARIAELPWVLRVEIERHLPGQLHIRIVERTPVARLRGIGRTALIDTGGAVIDTNVKGDRRFAHLPLLSGDHAEVAAPALMKLLSRHPKLGRRVIAAHYQGRRRWDLKFDTGAILLLPETHTSAAWDRFVLYAARHGLLNRKARHIDMRLHDRMVIRLDQPEPPKAPPAKTKRRRKGRNG